MESYYVDNGIMPHLRRSITLELAGRANTLPSVMPPPSGLLLFSPDTNNMHPSAQLDRRMHPLLYLPAHDIISRATALDSDASVRQHLAWRRRSIDSHSLYAVQRT